MLKHRHILKWLLGTLAFAGVSCQPDVIEQVTVPVTAVTVNPASLILQEGMSYRLEATVVPADATEPGLDWSSSDDRVATVDENGVVTAIAVGYANVIVKTRDGGKTAQCLVTVEGTTPPLDARWADTGADLPAWPSYNTVSKLEDFPRIDIKTNSGQPVRSKDTYEKGTISFRDPKKMYSDVTELKELKMQIRGRGNTTWEGQWGAKNPYRIKLDEHTRLFGMKGDKDWILLSDRLDPTMMRTAVALRISRLVSMPWTPKFRMAEVYLNGKYAGLYYLVEQKEPDRENKIPITVVAAGETDGGYLLELDDKEDSDAYFWSSTFGKKIKYKNPDPNDDDASERMTAAQKSFITNYFNKVERKLAAREFTGDDSYKAYVEMDSWIQNFFVHEVSMNIDGNMRLSTYFAKDSDTKLFIPFVWDFDRAFGNADYQVGDFALPQAWPYGWFVRIRGGYPDWDTRGKKPSWYQYMFEDPEFVDRVKELWTLYKPRLDMIPEFMDKMLEYDRLALQHNDTKFHNSYETRVRQLRDDYIKRIEWMDQNIRELKPQRYNQTTGTFQDL